MDVRKNIYCLTESERTSFFNAVLAMPRPTYLDFVQRHNEAMADNNLLPGESVGNFWEGPNLTRRNAAHRGPSFLPWHRAFIREFELELQSIDPTVTLPYWDWTQDEQLPDPVSALLWTDAYLGGDGAGPNDVVPDGPFTGWTASIANVFGNLVPRGFTGLVRRLGRDPAITPAAARTLPTESAVTASEGITPDDSAPWRETSDPSYRNRNEGWLSLPGDAVGSQLHNRVHTWVGGDMLPGTSPNDLVFFLHHCFVDFMWSRWQAANPAQSYAPMAGGPAGHNWGDVMGHLLDNPQPWRPQDTWNHAVSMDYVYEQDTSLAVALLTPAVSFTDVPTGETTHRAVVFNVTSTECLLSLRVVAGPTTLTGPANTFQLTPELGATAVVPATGALASTTARIWLRYTANAAATGTVRVRCDQLGQEWDVALSASVAARPNASAVLVLDQSGSMDWPAGGGETRVEVLQYSVPPFITMLENDDGIGMVRFNDDADPTQMSVTAAGVPVSGTGRVDAGNYLAGVNPGGRTSVGDGIIAGEALRQAASGYTTNAILVLTDGHENEPQSINAAMSTIGATDSVYAIGLGSHTHVDVAKLNAITNNKLLITGPLDAENEFLLTKYYLQILAGIKNNDIVVDPDGHLLPGAAHEVPFALTEADLRADVMLLTPAPYAFHFALVTPEGREIDPATAPGQPGITAGSGERILYYRVDLPLVTGRSVAHAGTWKVRLKVDDGGFREYLASLRKRELRLGRVRQLGVHYAVNVHGYSNLRMRGSVAQDGYEPGARVTLRVVLSEYGVPVEDRAAVQAAVSDPLGTVSSYGLFEVEPGVFEVSFPTSAAGLYSLRALAQGKTLRGTGFTREQTFTVAVTPNGDTPRPDPIDRTGEDCVCIILECLLDPERMGGRWIEHLESVGIKAEVLRKCLAEAARRPAEGPDALRPAGSSGGAKAALRKSLTGLDPQTLRRLASMVEEGRGQVR